MRRAAMIGGVICLSTIGLMGQSSAPVSSRGTRATPTFEKDILPIVENHCQQCHRPGQIGPFSLLDYRSARPWARSIKQAVLTRTMPPWYADPGSVHFENDRSLKQAEIDTLVAWVDAGAPQGDPKDAPPTKVWPPDGWTLKPDATFEVPAYEVPATGTVEWLEATIPTGFTEDKWVETIELLPGVPAVVHHTCVNFRPHTTDVKYGVWTWRDVERDADGVEVPRERPQRSDGQGAGNTQAAAQAPPTAGAEGGAVGVVDGTGFCYEPSYTMDNYKKHRAARELPAGWDLNISMHYTTNGTAVTDHSKIGMTFAAKAPDRRLIKRIASPNTDRSVFFIPPRESNWSGPTVEERFNVDAELVWLSPHMHLRGKEMAYTLIYPDGRELPVLKVSRYDYRWQTGYETSIQVPKGTILRVEARFNNSAANKLNPNPNRTVYWGQQTWEEMQGGYYDFVIPMSTNPRNVVTRIRNGTPSPAP